MATEVSDEKKEDAPEGGGGTTVEVGEGKDAEEERVVELKEEKKGDVAKDEGDVEVEVEVEEKVKKGKRDRKQVKRKVEEKEKATGEEADVDGEEDESENKKRKKTPPPTAELAPKEGGTGTPRVERPTRERKAVERYSVASPASRSSGGKSLAIAKGSGSVLKEIPNVAYKLSKRKPDDNLQLLHTILYGKKAKVHNLKKDIGQFSGFVWADNEEKQRAKTKEKLDKCVKEKLMDFCDVLNIPINKASVRKEDLSVKLLEFLESPHATTEVLLADSQKGKRKATPVKSRSSKSPSAEKSVKKAQSGEKRKKTIKADEEIEADDNEDNLDSHSLSSDEDSLQKQESDQDTESEQEEEENKEMIRTPENSAKDSSGAKNGKKSSIAKKGSSEKSAKSPAKSAKKVTVGSKKSTAAAEASVSSSKSKGSSKKKKVEEETPKEKPIPAEEKTSNKKQGSKSGAKSAAKEQGKGKTKKEVKSEPTNEDLRAQAVIILKQVDFNTATLSDILRILGANFGLDLMHRKGEVKAIITEVIESMSNDDDDEDDNEDTDDSGKE